MSTLPNDGAPVEAPSAPEATTNDGRNFADWSRLEQALYYHSLGWSVIPVCPHDHSAPLPDKHRQECKKPGKVPVVKWKKYTKQQATEEEIRVWWTTNPNYNIGVATGSISRLVVIDTDGIRGEHRVRQLFGGNLPSTVESETGGGGRHRFFALPEGMEFRTKALRTKAKQVNVQGEGNYVVMPGSMHASENPYVWKPGHAPWEREIATVPKVVLSLQDEGKPEEGRPV